MAYVQLAGGALPVSLSDSLRVLKERGLVEVAVAAGPCFDGDAQAVNVASALVWAAGEGFDVVVCGVGPGIVGTGSSLGHGGVAAAEAANLANALNGSPVVAVRVSEGDPRERHRGVSHHTRAVLGLLLDDVAVAWPAGLETPDWLGERRGGRRRGVAGGMRGPDPRAHGPRAGRRPVVLRVRLRGRQARASARRLMEERGLGPVVGLGTWNTFEDDADLARRVVGAALEEGCRPVRHVSDVRLGSGARERARGAAGRGGRRDEDLGRLDRGGPAAVRGSAALVRAGRDRAGAQPRLVGAAPALARGGARRRPDRPARRHALAGLGVSRARPRAFGPDASRRSRFRTTRSSGSASASCCRSRRSSAWP